MRLLLDTHILLSILNDSLKQNYPAVEPAVTDAANECFVSVASLWELTIKVRLGKLHSPVAPELLEVFLTRSGLEVIPVSAAHATARLNHDVPVRDPFDRLLIAAAQIENLRLVSADRALADHPVTFRPSQPR